MSAHHTDRVVIGGDWRGEQKHGQWGEERRKEDGRDVHRIFTKSDKDGRYTSINDRTKAQTLVDSNEECE